MSMFRPMVGHLLVFPVFVDGPPGSSAEFTTAEKTEALVNVYASTGVLRRLSEQWGLAQSPPVRGICGFTVSPPRNVSLTRDPAPLAIAPKTFDARDRIWLEDATAALGFGTGSVVDRFEQIRQGLFALTFLGLGVGDAFPIFITKYPCWHPASAPGSGAAVISWPEMAGFAGNIEGVMAHETGHVFDAPDEYANQCSTSDKAGFFDTPNGNCALLTKTPPVPAPGPRSQCLMSSNTHNFCPHTPRHWGWADDDQDGTVDLMLPATISLPDRATSPGEQFIINGRNVWDARVVFFGSEVADKPLVASPGSISVRVPPNASGIVNISLLTRAGAALGSFDDTWVLVAPAAPPASTSPVPMVFGVAPTSGPPGTTVKILGANLSFPTSITFGGIPADLSGLPPFPEGFGEQVEVPVPPGPTGRVPVAVTTSEGTSTHFPPFSEFTYV